MTLEVLSEEGEEVPPSFISMADAMLATSVQEIPKLTAAIFKNVVPWVLTSGTIYTAPFYYHLYDNRH